MDSIIRQALDDTGVSHYYGIKVVGAQVVILAVGGPVIYWPIPGQAVAGAPAPTAIPSGDLRRFPVAELRELALARSISITVGSRNKTKRHLIGELNALRQEEGT